MTEIINGNYGEMGLITLFRIWLIEIIAGKSIACAVGFKGNCTLLKTNRDNIALISCEDFKLDTLVVEKGSARVL